MKSPPQINPTFEPDGDRCLRLHYGLKIDAQTSRRCLAAAAAIEQAGLVGILDVTSSFTTVAIHYDPVQFAPTPYETISAVVKKIIKAAPDAHLLASRTVEVPVCYEGEYAMDLSYVADTCKISCAQVIERHIGNHVSVFALGFAPGLPYIGIHDEIFDLPRRPSPRAAVPAGSVAIANRQTVIYPNVTPGGWHVIGTMPIALFDPDHPPYAFLLPGDTVKFTPIGRKEFRSIHSLRS
ncbi:5-oxoprolinase subunit PxpB [Alcaligenaceae bacterium CGII-47]|nr:5-oxoprolinase subunit PxpB [Alcaligenaceae bacterium CGII-47]